METFNCTRFLEYVETTCNAIDAPFSKPTTLKVLEAYSSSFSTGVILISITSRPNDALNYHFYSRVRIDTVRIALDTGLLQPNHPLLPLLETWSKPWDAHIPEQSVDFDSEKGFSKIGIYQSGFRPLSNLLSQDGVPTNISQHQERFEDLDLNLLRHIAVDFHSETVTLDFSVFGQPSTPQILHYIGLAGSKLLYATELTGIERHISPMGFSLNVTITVTTGTIKRVAIYALGLPKEANPEVGDRVKKFFEVAPSYDAEAFRNVGWSFGGEERYEKADKSYCGRWQSG